MTVESVVKTATVQADGTISVQESHTRNGQVYSYIWTAPVGWTNADIVSACQLRGEGMDREMSRKEQIVAEAHSFTIPLTFYEFMDRFTAAERKLIRVKEKTDDNVGDFLDLARSRDQVYLNSPRLALAMSLLVSLNCITAARATEVLQ